MESNRLKKIGGLLQKELASILQNSLRDAGNSGIIISVSEVTVTPDLAFAKVYLSVFPSEHGEAILKEVGLFKNPIKHQVAQLVKNQLRKMPDLLFYLDRSLDYSEGISKALKRGENPIKNPDLLDKRKKS